jgi:hypothetical protein
MKYVLVLLIVFFSFFGKAQQDTVANRQLVMVERNDGKEYIGYILEDDGREILLETQSIGKIYISKADINNIVEIQEESDIIQGAYNTEGPFTTRYTFTTNALPIRKGENYAMVNLYGPEAHFALSDNFNIGVMSTWIASPLVVAMKYSKKTGNDNINVSAGLLAGTSGYLNSFMGYGGLAFGNITIGDRRRNITIAAGFLRIDPNVSDKEALIREGVYQTNDPYIETYSVGEEFTTRVKTNVLSSPMFSVGGFHKVGAKASFVFDSMLGVFSNNLEQNVVTAEVTAPTGNTWDNDYVPGVYRHEVTHTKGSNSVAFFLMPGMRFQKNENRAFQVSLAGVTVIEQNGDVFSFPLPTVAWYFKF